MPESPRRIATLSGLLVLATASAAQVVVIVVVLTGLQELSFRWIGLAGIATPAAIGAALAATAGATLAGVAGRVSRRRAFLLLGAVVLTWSVVGALIAPSIAGVVRPESSRSGQPFSVLSQNLWFENPRPADAARAVMARSADVVVLVEYTPEHRAAMLESGVADRYRYRWEQPEPGGAGLAVFSRIPFRDPLLLSSARGVVRLGVHVTLELDAGGVELLAVHPVAPSDYWGLQRWRQGYRDLSDVLAGLGPGAVVAGDFNATRSHRRFRELMRSADLRDAADAAGAGYAATWPDRGFVPPVMRLDHVLVGAGVGIESVEIVPSGGSDHRGVEARLRFPRS